MARNLTANFITEAQATSNRPIILFQGAFEGSTLRLWNGLGDLSWNSQTWLGNGWLQAIEGGEEMTEVESLSMTVMLSGIPATVLSLVLNDQRQNRDGLLYIGFLDPSTGGVVASPYLWWQGRYSHAEIEEGAEESVVNLYYDSPLADLDRPKERRWTDIGQQQIFSGDVGFQYVVAANKWNGVWGAEKSKPGGGRPPKQKKRRQGRR
jgi:hypothetical protein